MSCSWLRGTWKLPETPHLQAQERYFDKDGKPTPAMLRLWRLLAEKLDDHEGRIDTLEGP